MELHFYYSPYCPHCQGAAGIVEQAARTLGLEGTVRRCNVLEDIEGAVAAGVRMTPAVTLNGRLVAAGPMNPDSLVRTLAEVLAEEGNQQ